MSDKYISQEAIKNALVDKFKSRIGASRVPTWNDAFDAVTNLPPAADVVEVVRCRDCRYRDPEDKKCDSGELARAGCIFPVDDDYFCAYGKRKDGGQDP